MDKRVLVAYASKAGSTAEIAEKIGEVLKEHSFSVDVLPISMVHTLSQYRAIILGSAIRTGKILPEAMSFIEKNQDLLHAVPFSLFVVCLTMKKDDEINRKTVHEYLVPVFQLVEPAKVGLFAGALNVKRLGIVERMIIKALKAVEGDYRRWDQIESWAHAVPTQ